MQFLIRENFFKGIPKEIERQVTSKLLSFYHEIEKNSFLLRELPKGFWIKKISGKENLFEFRVNNGDRIFFNLSRRGTEDESITFLLYSTHDLGVKRAKRIGVSPNVEIQIDKQDFQEAELKEIENSYIEDYNNAITYEIKSDRFFQEAMKDRKYYYYYLNDEQYECIIKPLPLFVTGSAGSGKSTITLRKILNLEENQEIHNIKNVGYFTANRYLKDKVEEQYNFFRDYSKEPVIRFYTLKEFYKEYLKIDTRKISDFRKFREIASFSFPQRKKWGIEDQHMYSEIYGIIKGIMTDSKMDNWNRSLDSSRISLEEYLRFSSKYSVLNKEMRQKVYEVAVKYDNELEKQGYDNLNDLARKACSLGKKFDYLVVDEIQDLTEAEIYMLFSLVEDPRKILLAGDIHQMINSSYFSPERIKNLYYVHHINYSMDMLTKNYRSSKAIVELANHLAEMRSRYIGNMGMEDYRESFILDEGAVHLTKIDIEFIKRSQQDVNTAVVVADEEEKEKLYEKLSNRHRIFTVEEIKGLEYQNIICCNLTTSHIWAWENILKGKVKQDQRYRRYFNLFYVGITRARKELIIMEDNLNENPIINEIRKSITVKEEAEKEISVTTRSSTKEEWFEEGKKLYKLEKLEEAQYAFEQAGYPTWIKEREIETDIENSDYDTALKKIKDYNLENKIWHFRKLILDHAVDNRDFFRALEKTVQLSYNYREKEISAGILNSLDTYSQPQINRIIGWFKELRDHHTLGDIYFAREDYSQAGQHYEKSGNVKMVKKSREELLKAKYGHIKGVENIIYDIEEVLGNKGINAFGRDKKAPIHRAAEYKSIEVIEVLLELGAELDKPDNNHETPLFIASDRRDLEMVKYLLEHGADPNMKNRYSLTIIGKMDLRRSLNKPRTDTEERKDKVIRKMLVRFGAEGDRYEKDQCDERTGQSQDKV